MNGDSSPTTTGGSSPAATGGGGGGVTAVVTSNRPARTSGTARRGGDSNVSNNSSNNNKAWNPVITALAASSALSLQVTGTSLCHAFITVQAKPGELLAIVRTSVQEAETVANMGIFFDISDFYALGAYNNDDTDFMWKLARVFGAVSLTMGGIATVTAWATTLWSPTACCSSCTTTSRLLLLAPTGSTIWTGIAAAGAMAALLQVPTFLILEAYPCADFTQQQTCHLALGSYLVMASVVAWIVVTALTQLLDPPSESWMAARNNLEQWRYIVPKTNTAGESTQQDEEEEEEEDDIFNQVEEGGEISGIDDDDDGSQDPIFSPRPRQEHGNCFVSSRTTPSSSLASSSSSFWDGLLPWRNSSSSSTAPYTKPWQRCVKSSKSSNRHLNGGATAASASQSHRVVQRFSYASGSLATPSSSYNNNNNNHHPTSQGQLNGGDLVESSMLVEEAVESSCEESTITFESTTRRQRPTNWALLAQASSPDNINDDNMMGQSQARGLVGLHQQQHIRHVVDQQGHRDQQAPPPQGGQHHQHRHFDYPIRVLHGCSEWDKPEGIVPAEESLTASSFRTSSSGRDSPITGDESILDKDGDAKEDDASSAASSSAFNSQDEEHVKAVAVNGVPIYKDLLAEDEKKQDMNDSERQQQQHRDANLVLSGEDADDEHDDLEEENSTPLSSSSGLMEDPFFSELPGATNSTIHNTSSSGGGGGGGGGFNFLDITSNTNMTNNTTNTTTSRFLGVGLLGGIAAFRVRGSDSYYPFENDDDDDDDYELSNFSRGPPISEVQIYKLPNDDVEAAGGGGAAGSVMDDSTLDTIHPVSSSSEQELLQNWNDLFEFDDPHHTTLEDYRQESFGTSLEENISSFDQDGRLKSGSVDNKDIVNAEALDADGQQHQQRPGRGRGMEHEADRTGGETSDSSDNIINARDLKRRQMIAAVVRRTNNGGSGGVTLRPRRQHRRGRHNGDSVSSATSLLSFTIEEETTTDLMEEGGSDLDGGDRYDYDDDEIIDRARRVKNSIPLYREKSLPQPSTNSSLNSDGESGNTRPLHHRAAALPRGRLVDAQQDRVHLVQPQTGKDLKQEQQPDDEDHSIDNNDSTYQPISMHRRRSRSLEVHHKKSKRRAASRSLSPDRSVQSFTRNINKMWRVDREARSAMHNVPVISLSGSSDDDSDKIPSSGPNRARLSRIQRLQREREHQQQQPKDPPVTQDPPLTPMVMMDDATDASSEVVDDTTIETVEPMPHHDQGQLLLHCAVTPPRRGSSSICSSRSGGGLDDSVASSHESCYLLDTLEVSLAELQREDEMEYGPDENSI